MDTAPASGHDAREMSRPRPPPLPADLTARYEPRGVLGAGAMGWVYRARDRELDRLVAIKVARANERGNFADRFLREADTLASIEHPNVLRLLDYGVADESAYLITEYLEGESLDRGIGEADPASVMVQSAAGLQAVHEAGFLHRDVKPGNIFLTRKGRAVLIDFGLIQDPTRTRLTATGAVVGTLLFMAPEVLCGEHQSPASDWYGWAATFFYLIERRPPLTPEEILGIGAPEGGLARVPDPKPAVLDPRTPVGDLVLRGVSPHPEQRPAGLDEIRAVLAGRAVPGAAPRGVAGPVGPEGGRGARTRATLLALAGFGLGLGWMVPGRPAAPPARPPPQVDRAREGLAAGPFDAGYATRVRQELSEAAGLWVDPRGQVVSLDGDPPGPGYRELLDPDPAAWGRLASRLPELRRFQAWVGAGGRPEALPSRLRAKLKRCDEWYLSQGLGRPFYPYAYLGPSPVPRALSAIRGHFEPGWGAPDPPPAGGWLAQMDLALQDLEEGFLRREAEIGKSRVARKIEEMAAHDIFRSVIHRDLSQLVKMPSARAEGREVVARWLRAEAETLLRFLYAARRSIDLGGEAAEMVAFLTARVLVRYDPFFMAGFSSADPAPLLGQARDDPAEGLFRFAILRQLVSVRIRWGVPVEDLDARRDRALGRAAAGAVLGPWAALRRGQARLEGLRQARERRDPAPLLDFLERRAEGDPWLPPGLGLQADAMVLRAFGDGVDPMRVPGPSLRGLYARLKDRRSEVRDVRETWGVLEAAVDALDP